MSKSACITCSLLCFLIVKIYQIKDSDSRTHQSCLNLVVYVFFKVVLTRSITNALRVIRRGQRWVRCMKTKLRFSCEDDFCFTVNDSEHSNWKYLETFLILVSAIMNG